MKTKTLSRITTAIVVIFCMSATTVLAQKKVLNPGTLNIEKNDRVYSSKDIRGSATIGSSKQAIMSLECTLRDGKRILSLRFDLKKIGEFQPGTVAFARTANEEEPGNFVQFLNYPQDEETESADEGSGKDISSTAEKGTFTLTNIRFDDVKAIISGNFEFTGPNDIDSGSEKTVTVKGTFDGVSITCMGPHP
ncbi:hypothetical protein [Chitinophaga rhizophila]|uniref:YceI-like domain-containing protein n=1 Tax=Chitinophaga rhizophila TaxID=2866212 RepID=A0ABS7G6A4_9BACT|nr:hypothetical protein [Chitinophaga rhizophila]MBW8683187.1 hypothetical protein [Chitinophaga rhizophila]